MKFRLLLLIFGFTISIFFISYWQGDFLLPIFSLVKGNEKTISPLAKIKDTGINVLGEGTSIVKDNKNLNPKQAILSQGAFVYDLTANKVIFEKNCHQQLQAASTVKIVTAAVALDRGKLDEEITVNSFPTIVGESSMNLVYGEKFTLKELLYGLLLVSGNDSAETIAQGLAGTRETYVGWMNEFAKKVGANETNFMTASGLDEDGQYTTAYDLFLMGREVFTKYPEIVKISTTKEITLPASKQHREYMLKNKLLLLDYYNLLGAKPGLGENDLLSLVCLIEKDGKKFLTVLIKTPSIGQDLNEIFKIL